MTTPSRPLTLAEKLAILQQQRAQPGQNSASSPQLIKAPQVTGAEVSQNPPGQARDYASLLGTDIDKIEGFDASKFFLKLEELSSAIHANAPGVPTYLEQINQQLNQYPELVHKLSPEKIKIVVQGALKITGIQMAEVITKKRSKLSAGEIMDLGF